MESELRTPPTKSLQNGFSSFSGYDTNGGYFNSLSDIQNSSIEHGGAQLSDYVSSMMDGIVKAATPSVSVCSGSPTTTIASTITITTAASEHQPVGNISEGSISVGEQEIPGGGDGSGVSVSTTSSLESNEINDIGNEVANSSTPDQKKMSAEMNSPHNLIGFRAYEESKSALKRQKTYP